MFHYLDIVPLILKCLPKTNTSIFFVLFSFEQIGHDVKTDEKFFFLRKNCICQNHDDDDGQTILIVLWSIWSGEEKKKKV